MVARSVRRLLCAWDGTPARPTHRGCASPYRRDAGRRAKPGVEAGTAAVRIARHDVLAEWQEARVSTAERRCRAVGGLGPLGAKAAARSRSVALASGRGFLGHAVRLSRRFLLDAS